MKIKLNANHIHGGKEKRKKTRFFNSISTNETYCAINSPARASKIENPRGSRPRRNESSNFDRNSKELKPRIDLSKSASFTIDRKDIGLDRFRLAWKMPRLFHQRIHTHTHIYTISYVHMEGFMTWRCNIGRYFRHVNS